MIIDLRPYKQKGINASEFEFTFVPKNELPLFGATLIGDIKILGEFQIKGRDVFVSGKICFTVEADCARCLAKTNSVVSISFFEKFISDLDDEHYRILKDKVDLGDLAESLIQTDCPYAIYCKDDCKGICQNCGKNLNNEQCVCTNKL